MHISIGHLAVHLLKRWKRVRLRIRPGPGVVHAATPADHRGEIGNLLILQISLNKGADRLNEINYPEGVGATLDYASGERISDEEETS
jgi:hypothetical protein